MAEKLYFAYGSNINLEQMEYRCPAAKAVGPVILENYELLFRGNTRGNGVATIAPREGSKVHGLLWWITPACEQSLDFYEGYPRLDVYKRQEENVRIWVECTRMTPEEMEDTVRESEKLAEIFAKVARIIREQIIPSDWRGAGRGAGNAETEEQPEKGEHDECE